MATFDLVIEGHCSVRNTLPVDTVENAACHREAHDAKDGLHKEQQKQHYMSKCRAIHKNVLIMTNVKTY